MPKTRKFTEVSIGRFRKGDMGAFTREEEVFIDVIDILKEKVRELESDKNFDRITGEKYQDEGMKIDWEVFCLEYAMQKYYGIG